MDRHPGATPQAAAYAWVTSTDAPPSTWEISHDAFARRKVEDSPVTRLRLGAPSVRFRRDRASDEDPPDVHDLGRRGYTDLFGLSVTFRGAWVGAVTWATRGARGFSEADIERFEALHPALCAVLQPLARDMLMATLLRTYLGHDAGSRVFAGQVRRGDLSTLRAAVWFSDVREFTRRASCRGRIWWRGWTRCSRWSSPCSTATVARC